MGILFNLQSGRAFGDMRKLLLQPGPDAYDPSVDTREGSLSAMLHRHLNHQRFTLAAIDDVIGRGKRQDWAELRRAALHDRLVLEKVLRVCKARVQDPYAQRYHFWKHYAERLLA